MPRSTEVHIERLAVRLQGVPAPIARAAVAGVGWDLMHRLAQRLVPPPAGRTDQPLLDAGIVRVSQPAREDGVRDAIVRAISSSVESAWAAEGKG